MRKSRHWTWGAVLLAAADLPCMTFDSVAKQPRREEVIIRVADPNQHSDGSMSAIARRAMRQGALPVSPSVSAAKEAADRATLEATQSGKMKVMPSEVAVKAPLAPAISDNQNFDGIRADTANTLVAPSDSTGAIGKNRYIQLVNSAARIINRSTHAVVAEGSLNQLAGISPGVSSFDPQIIWDPTTERFYYAMVSVYSTIDNRISWGFSTTASPGNLSSDWCHYAITTYGIYLPDYPKLGDSKHFIVLGINAFDAGTDAYDGSDIVALSKPPKGANCPTARSFKRGIKIKLRDLLGDFVFTPVPANQIDGNETSYVVAVDGHAPPLKKLWFFNVSKDSNGVPVFSSGRSLSVPEYDLPSNAPQSNRLFIDTSDMRNTQAVQAINPTRAGNVHSFWTQHTIKDTSGPAVVRWYEIDPAVSTPRLLRSGTIAATGAWAFNGAISPDRQVNGSTKRFGDSFVIHYNVASLAIDPRIVARSSLHGGTVSPALLVKNGVEQYGAYADFSCIFPSGNRVCRWGDYAAATPDPAPGTTGSGVVWGTSQYSGKFQPLLEDANWRTRIFAVKP